MEQLVNQDAFKFTALRENTGVEQDHTAGNGSSRVMRTKRRAHFHSNRATLQAWQHDGAYFKGTGGRGPGTFGVCGACRKNSWDWICGVKRTFTFANHSFM